MSVLRVLIADDDASFRSALADTLEEDPRFTVVGSASDGSEMLRLHAALAPDLVLVDIRMPGGGAEAARALVSAPRPGRPPVVIALSAQSGAGAVLAMLRAGATGYLTKGRVGHQLPDLVARVADGSVVLCAPGAADALRQLLAE